jgi:tRNA(Ile)-lysidine synthase
MTDVPAHVEASVRQRGLAPHGARMLVAVSGGLDSVVLLRVLHGLATRHGWQLAVAHLNHQLRGRSSDADERFVRRLAGQLELPCFVERVAVGHLARRQKLSVEMAARRLRHEFLVRCARRFKARRVALAHHADDQVELFFIRLLRGAGGEGMQGMKWCSASPASRQIQLVRPLLDISRETLSRYARRQKLTFREDATNASPDILRNRIRHRLLPLLRREFQPAISQTVTRLMDIIGAEASYVRTAAAAWLRKPHAPSFGRLSTAVQRAVIRQQLHERGISGEFDLVENLTAEAGRRVSVGMNVSVWRDSQGRVHVAEPVRLQFAAGSRSLALKNGAGECEFGGLRIRWRLGRKRGAARPSPSGQQECFDADAIGTPIRLRHWRPGDRFQPIGMPRPAKLQNLLTNARIPAPRRRELAVAEAADGRLFWVEGLRISEPFKLTTGTKRRLHWRWKRVEELAGRVRSRRR